MKHFITILMLLSASAGIAQPAASTAAVAARPGDDFDAYVNGAWRATTEIPADRSSTGVGYEVFKVAEARTAELIAGAAKLNAVPGSDTRRVADYYAAFLDTDRIEARGLAPLKPRLAAIAALKDGNVLSAMLGASMRADTDPLNVTSLSTENLFGLFVTQDLSRPTVTVPYLMQGGLGLPDRDYYLSAKPEMGEVRTAYLAYVTKLLGLAGMSEPAARAARIVAFETRIARAHADIVTSQNAATSNNPWKRADFATRAPGIDWDAYWTAAALPKQQDFIVWQPSAVVALSAMVRSEPLTTWQDWLAFHTINQVTDVLPAAFDQAHFDFYGTTLNGTPSKRTRDKRAIAATNEALGDAVGKLYAARYFPASSKAAIQSMVRNIVAAFDARIVALDWMAPATKAEARRKLAVLIVGVGYPDVWRSSAGFEVRSDDPVANLRGARLLHYHQQIAKIGKPVDRAEWWMTPQTVNAVNLPLQNALNFPAAILETPYFDPRFDAASNYGAIGAVIGHEISHSFDNLGADFDSTGKLRNWWTKADLARFEAAGKALALQYDGYEALPGLHLNGDQELGENIADVAGLAAAYQAYRISLGGKPDRIVDGKTGDQRFFLAYANAWRTKMRDKALRARIAGDVHAPAMWRVQTVRNIDAWYDAFKVEPGQKLYLVPDKRVKIW